MKKISFAIFLVSCLVVLSLVRADSREEFYHDYGYDDHSSSDGKLQCYACSGCNDPFQTVLYKPVRCAGVCVKVTALEDSPPTLYEVPYKEGDMLRDCFCAGQSCSRTPLGHFIEKGLHKQMLKSDTECHEEEMMGHKFDVCYCKEGLCNGSGDISVSTATVMMTFVAVLSSFQF